MLCYKKKLELIPPIKKNHDQHPTSSSVRALQRSKSHSVTIPVIYQSVLKSIIASLIPHCPKEILIEISKFINTIYPKLKDSCMNSYMLDDTVKRREFVWKNITKRIQDVLYPLIHAINTEQKPLLSVMPKAQLSTHVSPVKSVEGRELNHAIKTYTKRHSDNFYWPIPREINFLQIKDADDVATITCKVGNFTIPYAMIDSGSDSSILSENVAKHLGLKIDRKKVHRLIGVASKSQSLGTINDIPVTISSGGDSVTVTDDFSVVPTEYDNNGNELSLFILGTQWQYRAGWEPLIKGEFRATCDGKTITIPLSVHKSQRNVFKVEKDGDISETIKKTILPPSGHPRGASMKNA